MTRAGRPTTTGEASEGNPGPDSFSSRTWIDNTWAEQLLLVGFETGEPLADQIGSGAIDDARGDVRHAPEASQLHAVQDHGASRIARDEHLGIVQLERALSGRRVD